MQGNCFSLSLFMISEFRIQTPEYFLLEKLVLFSQEFARHSPFIITRILSMQDGSSTIPTISLLTNIFSSRSCFYRRILFYGTFKFQSLSLNQKTPRCRDASTAARVNTVDASSSAERVSIVNTDAILEGGFRLWYSQVSPSIRPRLSKHDNNSSRFPRKISSTIELYSNIKTVFTILILK